MKKLLAVSLLFLVSLMFSSLHAATPETISGATKVDAEKVIELVEELDNLVVIDARTQADFSKGHIPGAISLPNVDTNADTLANALGDKNQPVLFYCNGVNCGRSVESCNIAVKEGYNKIYWFRGGIGEWKEKGFPLEQ